jgi:hypothetical protein
MRRLLRLALAVIALALVGSAAAGPRDPKVHYTKAGQAIARSAVLRPSDFARGWRPVSRSARRVRCRYYNPDLSRLTRIGAAHSAFRFSRQVEVGSAVSVFLDARQAATAFRVGATRAFLACAVVHFAKGLARSGPVRVTLKRMTAGPPLGIPSRTFRTGYRLRWRGRSLAYRYDVIAFQADKAVGLVWFWWIGSPFRYETDIVRRVASRL